MKKELLIASALTASFGLAGVAEAATASWSGSSKNGVSGSNLDSSATGDSTYSASQQHNLSFSVSETTDGGMTIATGFTVVNEASASHNGSGLTLTFKDESTLDLVEAGNAYGGALASIPGASGEQSVSATSLNHAPTDLDWADTSDAVGFDWGSAEDFAGIDGLTVGVSAAFGDDGDSTSTATAETSYSIGVTLDRTVGDTDITVGGGMINAGSSNNGGTNDKANSVAMSAAAVIGDDLTVGVGFSTGSSLYDSTTDVGAGQVDSASIVKAGVSFVSGDMTFAVGYYDGESKDSLSTNVDGANVDSISALSASASYAVADGVTAILGYTDVSAEEEGSSNSGNSGSSWYVGASISF